MAIKWGQAGLANSARQLRLGVAAIAPGSEVELEVIREGQPKQIQLELGQFPGEEGKPDRTASAKGGNYGLSVSELTPETARELGLDPGSSGVLITAVKPGSPAAEAGLRRGDVIQEAARQPVSAIADLRKAVEAAAGEPLLLLVNRSGQTTYIVLESD